MYSPTADASLLNTFMVTSVDDGLLNTNTGCTDPLYSSTLYEDSLKLMVIAKRSKQ